MLLSQCNDQGILKCERRIDITSAIETIVYSRSVLPMQPNLGAALKNTYEATELINSKSMNIKIDPSLFNFSTHMKP